MPRAALPNPAARCRRKFLKIFPGGFRDETYLEWERDYKVETHERWQEALAPHLFRKLLESRSYEEIAARAIRVEQRSRHSMLFSFEKMALRDAVRAAPGARTFAEGLYAFLHGGDPLPQRFERWVEAIASLPRRQTRVLTWPLATVFGFIAQPKAHFFFKPTVTREALRRSGIPLQYSSRPNWPLYKNLLDSVAQVRREIAAMRPRDMIDMQSFLWVQGSDEYPD